MKINLTPEDRKDIIDALEWMQRDRMEHDTSGLSEVEYNNVYRDVDNIGKHYNKLIRKIEGFGANPRKRKDIRK